MQQNLETLANENFADNITYLQENHPKIFDKIASLTTAVDNGHYENKYDLVVVNNHFDVLELQTNKHLYNGDILKHSELSAKHVNYTKTEDCFESFSSVSKQYANKYLYAYLEVFTYLQQKSRHNLQLNKIDKFIFFGTGLGLHLQEIDKKISAKVYLIVEDDLELFKLSLFTCNYYKLSQNSKLVFSIFENSNEFSDTAKIFLETHYQYGHFIKYYYLLSHAEDKIALFHKEVSSQAHLKFFYTSLLTQYLQPLKYIANSAKFISNTLHFDNNILNKENFLLLAAGPSLQKNISWLKKNHSNFITVAVSATLPYLEESNIVPDIIINLDAFDEMNTLFKKIKNIDFFKDSICLFSGRTQEYISKNFQQNELFFFESGTKYKKTSLRPIAPCVGSLSYQLLLLLRVKNLYLLGLDLAIDEKSSKTHLGIHTGATQVNINSDKYDDKDYHKSLVKLAGNFKKEVYSSYYFNDSRISINNSTKKFTKFTKSIFNLSDGVKFESIPSLDMPKIKTKTKNTQAKEMILNLLNQSSATNFDDKESIKDKLRQAKKLQHELKMFKSISTLDDYDKLINHNFLESNKYELNKIIKLYMRYVMSYIFDFFNKKNIPNKKEHLNKIHHIFFTNLCKILNQYIKYIEDYQCKR